MKKKNVFASITAIVLVLLTMFSVCTVGVNAVLNFDDDYGDFLNKLGYYESRNTYNIENEYGYMGRWQMGYSALIDIGFMDWDYNYTEKAHRYGVYSDSDFLNKPDAQDFAIQEFDKKLWSYIEWYGDEKYVGQTFDGIKITVSGLIGAAHLAGAGGLHEMLVTGISATDAYGSKASFYLEELGGYRISRSIGADVYDNEADRNYRRPVSVSGVSLSSTSAKLNLGSGMTLTASVSPSNASNKNVTWTSSDNNVATVSGGKVTAKGIGNAVMTVTTVDGSKKATCKVTVRDYPVKLEITRKPKKTSYIEGESLDTTNLKAVATFKSGEKRTIISALKVSGYNAAKVGTQSLTVSYTSAGVTVYDKFAVTVRAKIHPTSVTLDYSKISVLLGKYKTLKATVKPTDSDNKSVKWSSSDTKIATVSSTGMVTAKGLGTAVITAATVDGGKKASCTVTVRDYPVKLEVVKAPTKTSYIKGEDINTKGIKVTATFKSGEKRNIVSAYKLSGFDKNKVGTQTVTVTYKSAGVTVKDSFTVTVKKRVAVKTVSLNIKEAKINLGKSVTLDATVSPSSATNKKLIWSSSDKNIATVTSDGKVTAKGVGTATITVKSEDGSHKATCKVVVRDYPVSLDITQNPKKTAYKIGESLNTSGMKVVATFKTGEKRNIVSAYKISGYDKNKAGTQTVTVKYTSAGVTVKDTFKVTVK